jgi:hypothetical protein
VSRSSKPPNPDEERPTVIPPYDVEEMARRARSSAPAPLASDDTPTVMPPNGPEEFRGPASTLSNEHELEAARIASMYGSTPPSRPPVVGRWSIAPGPPRELPGDEPAIEILADLEGAEVRFDPLDEARVLIDGGEEAAALAILEGLLRRSPANVAVRGLAEECESILVAKYTEELGSLARSPKIAVPVSQLVSLSLDHRAGFLISLVDGVSSLALIVDLSGMSSREVLGTFVDLKQRGVVTFR